MALYVDLSDLLHHAYHNSTITGIQRVQIEVARRLIKNNGTHIFSCHQGLYVDLTKCVIQYIELTPNEFFKTLRRLFGHPFSPNLPFRNGHDRVVNALNYIGRFRRYLGPWLIRRHPTVGQTDTIFVGGAFWADPHSINLYERAHLNGTRLIVFFHDVIPLTYSQFTDGGAKPYFNRMLRLPLHVITNSEFTKRDLLCGAASVSDSSPFLSINVVPLAQEFVGACRNQSAKLVPPAMWASQLGDMPFVLSVGTVEIRKNHAALLKLWRRLSLEFEKSLPKLIIAGRRGWMAQEALNILDQSPADNYIGYAEAPTDEELAWLYAASSFTIFPSFAEGWGLPVGESLWFGKPCIASKTTSIPEVGQDLCQYADPEDIETFADAIRLFLVDKTAIPRATEKIKASTLRSWAQVIEEITSAPPFLSEESMDVHSASSTTS